MSTTKTPTTIPTALERVRAFVREAKAQGDDEVAWSVPDHYPDANRGRLLALSIGDLEEVLALVGPAGCTEHPNVFDETTDTLLARAFELDTDQTGHTEHEGDCYWNDSAQIDAELDRRGVQ